MPFELFESAVVIGGFFFNARPTQNLISKLQFDLLRFHLASAIIIIYYFNLL